MIRLVISLLLSLSAIFALQEMEPTCSMIAKGDVQDMAVQDQKLYAATNKGSVDIFDLEKRERIDSIEIPRIEDFMGKKMDAKIYSVDSLEESVLFVSEGLGGYRKLWLFREGELQKIVDEKSRYFIKKARFVDRDRVLIALLSNEHILYDMRTKKEHYNIQMSTSSFSDFTMDEEKMRFATSDESGIVRVVDTLSGKVLKEYKGQNVDRVYQVDIKDGTILTAGQDRRAAIYSVLDSYYLEFDFLLYSAALSQDASLAAVAYNEENHILVYRVDTKRRLYDLKGSLATVTKILFLSRDEIVASSDSATINCWKLK